MGNHEENVWVSQGQRTILSVGEGQGHVGDAFTIFRVRRALRHPKTGLTIGYFVQVLGKAEITQPIQRRAGRRSSPRTPRFSPATE